MKFFSSPITALIKFLAWHFPALARVKQSKEVMSNEHTLRNDAGMKI